LPDPPAPRQDREFLVFFPESDAQLDVAVIGFSRKITVAIGIHFDPIDGFGGVASCLPTLREATDGIS
jgi:hypothetical protein